MGPVSPTAPAPAIRYLALMLTRRCNMTCAHCSVESGPGVRGEPDEAALLDRVRQAGAAGVRTLQLTGGEPMLRAAVARRLCREARRHGMAVTMTTNGFWGKAPRHAHRTLAGLARAGLGALTVSYDRYHADFQGLEPVLHIAAAARALGVPMAVNVVRVADDAEVTPIIEGLRAHPEVRLRLYDVQPVGRARELPPETLREELAGFCSACAAPALTEDGRMLACNGPAFSAPAGSPLHVGSLREASLTELLARHAADPILDTIRTGGPSRLREELVRVPGFESFPFRRRYAGICDLCLHVTSHPGAVAALRTRLADPGATAARRAAWEVIRHAREAAGPLTGAYVNGVGACRVFLRAAWQPEDPWGPEAERVLVRGDLDWRRLARYLTGCGLARPLAPVLADPRLGRHAPAFFVDDLRAAALREGLRGLVQQSLLRQVVEVLRALGIRGVLLKGSALALAGGPRVPRAASDVDVLVEPARAPEVYRALRARGLEGPDSPAPSAPHQLPPLRFQGGMLEVHTAVMGPLWGLPEADMLRWTLPLPAWAPLETLDPAGQLLHAGVHAGAHVFAYGLKTAWDVRWLLEREAGVDWDRLSAWLTRTETARAFWATLGPLAEALELPVPAAFLAGAPRDAGARRLALIAGRRLFTSTESFLDVDPITKTGLFLLLHDSWPGRARYVATQLRWRGARGSAWARPLGELRGGSALRQAWRRWGQYRRAGKAAGR
jgi:pyruvate-formate lyase-activating enzyme